jgi:solute carrier family 26 (sodium-independent sulfate anion transporter), member 11
MASTGVKTQQFLAKAVGIKLNTDSNSEGLTRGESVFSLQTADTFVEPEPTSGEWIREHIPSGQDVVAYARSLFPFTYWIGRYNLQWLIGDLVAGNSPLGFWDQWLTSASRHHDWRRCGAARDGICPTG